MCFFFFTVFCSSVLWDGAPSLPLKLSRLSFLFSSPHFREVACARRGVFILTDFSCLTLDGGVKDLSGQLPLTWAALTFSRLVQLCATRPPITHSVYLPLQRACMLLWLPKFPEVGCQPWTMAHLCYFSPFFPLCWWNFTFVLKLPKESRGF